jgi:hypothetical protein
LVKGRGDVKSRDDHLAGLISRTAASAWLLLCVFAISGVGLSCGASGGASNFDCEFLCEDLANCASDCDPEESPDCSREENIRREREACLRFCDAGSVEYGDACQDAVEQYGRCVDGTSCNRQENVECEVEQRRFLEICNGARGGSVCGEFCTELEIGCIPYTDVGFRGNGCDDECFANAANLDCLEAHYAVSECIADAGGRRYSCDPYGDLCIDEFDDLRLFCESWEIVTPDPDEIALCEEAAALECECDYTLREVNCEIAARERCLYALGLGSVCENAIIDFNACMASIDECNRDILRDTCLPEWQARTGLCFIR